MDRAAPPCRVVATEAGKAGPVTAPPFHGVAIAALFPYNRLMDTIVIYTDGGCFGNPGPGGWAYLVLVDGETVSASGGDPETTNNRMELTAVIRALEAVRGAAHTSTPIELHTDSQYVKRGITEWISQWERNGWRTAGGDAVKNQELWRGLKGLTEGLPLTFRWVKGHKGDPLNERCDAMVKEAIAAVRRGR